METAAGDATAVPRVGSETLNVPPELMVVLPAVPTSGSIARDRFRTWLDDLAWPEAEGDDVLMAANEAIANVIDHAYLGRPPGEFHVHAWQVGLPHGRRIVVTVTDRGRWRPFRADQGYRGHGVPMMVGCMESVQIEHAEGGTTVVMGSATVPNQVREPGAASRSEGRPSVPPGRDRAGGVGSEPSGAGVAGPSAPPKAAP